MAQSARAAVDELRQSLVQIAGGDVELATVVVNAATERAIERDRAEKLERQNGLLTQRLREEMRLRKSLHNTLEDLKGAIRVLVRMRPLLPHEETHPSREYEEVC